MEENVNPRTHDTMLITVVAIVVIATVFVSLIYSLLLYFRSKECEGWLLEIEGRPVLDISTKTAYLKIWNRGRAYIIITELSVNGTMCYLNGSIGFSNSVGTIIEAKCPYLDTPLGVQTVNGVIHTNCGNVEITFTVQKSNY